MLSWSPKTELLYKGLKRPCHLSRSRRNLVSTKKRRLAPVSDPVPVTIPHLQCERDSYRIMFCSFPQIFRPNSTYPTSSSHPKASTLTGGPPCTCTSSFPITQEVTRPTQMAYSQKCCYSWSCCAPSIGRTLSMLDEHLLRNLVLCPKDDIATHLPAQALTKFLRSDLSQSIGKPSSRGRMSIEATFWPGALNALAFHLDEPRFYGSCCALTS